MPGPASLRHYLRRLIYENAALQWAANRYSGRRHLGRSAAFWNDALTGDFSSYLGGTLSIDLRNTIVATLIRNCTGSPVSVLDVGCSGGSLAGAIGGLSHYTGVDVSDRAIAHAIRTSRQATSEQGNPTIEFVVADLCGFPVNGRQWRVIVFNEVLYYLSVPEALDQVNRYVQALHPDGILLVSMKDDGKSRAIFRYLEQRYSWKTGVLHQVKNERTDFTIRIDREQPAHLIAVLKPCAAEPA